MRKQLHLLIQSRKLCLSLWSAQITPSSERTRQLCLQSSNAYPQSRWSPSDEFGMVSGPRAAAVPLAWEGTVEREARKRGLASPGGHQASGPLDLAPAQLDGEAVQDPAWE